MVGCALKRCKNNKKNKPPGVTFHIFPSDPIIRERWRRIIARERKDENYKPSDCSVVCSEHFKHRDTYFSKKGFKQIKKFAIPHIQSDSNCVNDYLIETNLMMSEASCPNLSQVDEACQSNQILDSLPEEIQSKDTHVIHNKIHKSNYNNMFETFKEENLFTVPQFQAENSSSTDLIKRERNGSHKRKRSDSEVLDPPIFADYKAELKKFKRKLSFKDKQIRNLRQKNRRLKEANETMKQLLRDVRKMFD